MRAVDAPVGGQPVRRVVQLNVKRRIAPLDGVRFGQFERVRRRRRLTQKTGRSSQEMTGLSSDKFQLRFGRFERGRLVSRHLEILHKFSFQFFVFLGGGEKWDAAGSNVASHLNNWTKWPPIKLKHFCFVQILFKTRNRRSVARTRRTSLDDARVLHLHIFLGFLFFFSVSNFNTRHFNCLGKMLKRRPRVL